MNFKSRVLGGIEIMNGEVKVKGKSWRGCWRGGKFVER
jgi:hypothetical protein